MPEAIINLVVLLIVLGIVGVLLSQTVRVVREYRRLVVFRLGNCIGARGPGLVLLIPFVDRPVDVDLRELFVEIPHQSCITKDNVPIQIDFLVYRQVLDAVTRVVAITNFASASQALLPRRCARLLATSCWTTCWRAGSKLTTTSGASWTRSPNAGAAK